MFWKKKTYLLSIISILLLVLTACAKGGGSGKQGAGTPQEKVEITFVNWATAEEATKKQMLAVIEEFEKQNPNIKVKNVPIPVGEQLNQLTIMTTGGNAPDIAQVHFDVGISLAAMGALEPTENLLSKEFLEDVNKKLYDFGIWEGKHYLIPWVGHPLGFWYNKKILKEAGLDPNNPPQTMDELTKAMGIIKEKFPEVIPLQIDTTIRTLGLSHEWSFMAAFGAVPIEGDKVQANKMGPFAEWLRMLVKKGYTLPGKKFGEFRPLAAQNRLAFGFDGPSFKGIVQSFDKTITDEKFYETWGVTTLPVGVDKKPYSAPDDHNLAIFKASKHKEAAAKFAEFLARSDFSIKTYVIPLGFLPTVQSAIQRFPKEFSDPARKAYVEKVVPAEVRLPYGPNYSKIATVVMAGMQEVITTDKPIPEILNNIQMKLEGIVHGR
ncbi:carbohydrate ABC transporter substrate-binding protein, CUT1 family [Thermanaeromonas toyohensis ToBE]|uniref:Carbohydrate ABC transporter substrate-binding protein, CUT1 family n=1 Tax=Thermanaeromonas toyohensis ToBE TaxID=698762 RepID=A0A1W1VV87_9FIRM|nr:sugar ABC transporter substrate-binding protein [Thermanaeromonas toyohensis]SMB97285.1 carbohydrate ABC transporter substrate-binding protein, CUT1 family [Thermanaeromonas toyohensis ToBE]